LQPEFEKPSVVSLVSYTALSKLTYNSLSCTANEIASCDWLTAPALLNASYWSVIYRDKKPKPASIRAFEYYKIIIIIASHEDEMNDKYNDKLCRSLQVMKCSVK